MGEIAEGIEFNGRTIDCPYCGGQAHLTDSARVYRGRSYGLIYLCENYPRCDAYVGIHEGTVEPLGRLANKALRQTKMRAHRAFDPLWREAPALYDLPADSEEARVAVRRIRSRARTRAYEWLAEQLGIPRSECHFGQFDQQQCARAQKACKQVNAGYIRDWAKERGL